MSSASRYAIPCLSAGYGRAGNSAWTTLEDEPWQPPDVSPLPN